MPDDDKRRGGRLALRVAGWVGRHGKRAAVAIVGVVVLLAGLALIVLPGPAIIVIPAGLAILATQFKWARRLLDRLRDRAGEAMHRFRHHGDDCDDDGAGGSPSGDADKPTGPRSEVA